MFSGACNYGLQAMFYIARKSSEDKNNHIDLTEIAEAENIPKHFLSKILQQLVKRKILISMKGPTGGFKLSRSSEKISLAEVINAFDELEVFSQCGMLHKQCDDNEPCPIHDDFKEIREKMYHLFQYKTFEKPPIETGEGKKKIKN
ncbi:MAG: Rrf2 family transcriptional regulator [Balneolales bacterium]